MKLDLGIKKGADREEIADALKSVSEKIWNGEESGPIRDGNGNTIGAWWLVDWNDQNAIFRYATARGLSLYKSDIREALDGDGYMIDTMPAEEWIAAMLAD